jgi:nucleoside-diphosphate-sugar epimerase
MSTSEMSAKQAVVIFGGAGFIGTHLAQHLLLHHAGTQIILVDLREPRNASYCKPLQEGLASGAVRYVQHDVRKPIPAGLCAEQVETIYNLAAIHREPGHQISEYFETNLLGAEHVVAYATGCLCKRIVFMSSISPYGPSEEPKTELSVPTPESPYGSSKLAAEKIHLGWQSAGPDRKLLILRPGVVFGPGEGGNVTRLLRSLVRGYFVYMGNRGTRKAAGYVKELAHVIHFGLDLLEQDHFLPEGKKVLLLNFSLNPSPTVEDFVNTIQHVGMLRRPVLSLPRSLLLAASYPIDTAAKLLGISQPISPVRVRKLFRSTNVQPMRLGQLGYEYKYTLESAFRDWKNDAPQDFVK